LNTVHLEHFFNIHLNLADADFAKISEILPMEGETRAFFSGDGFGSGSSSASVVELVKHENPLTDLTFDSEDFPP